MKASRGYLSVTVALAALLAAPSAFADPVAPYEKLLDARGTEYARQRSALLEEGREAVEPFLVERRAATQDETEKRILDALLARLRQPEEVARLERVYRETARKIAGCSVIDWHVIYRPDPELTVDGMWLYFEGEDPLKCAPVPYERIDVYDPSPARLPASPLWDSLLAEIVLKGWTATDEPTPPPIPFERLKRLYLGGSDAARFEGPTAPNGDVYVLYAIELLARRSVKGVTASIVDYARTHAGYPERQRRAVIALRKLGDPEAVPALLELALSEALYLGTRRSAFDALAALADRSVIPALEPLARERAKENPARPTRWALCALRVIKSVRKREEAK